MLSDFQILGSVFHRTQALSFQAYPLFVVVLDILFYRCP